MSKLWDHFLCYVFIDELFSVDSVTLLPDCQAIDGHGFFHPVVLMKNINSLTDVLGSFLWKILSSLLCVKLFELDQNSI